MFIKNIGRFMWLSFFILGATSVDSFGMKKPQFDHITVLNGEQAVRINIQDRPKLLRLIREINNPDALRSFLDARADQSTLVVFDCDEVLLTDGGTRTLNNKINGIVNALQDKGIKVLVLTAVHQLDARIHQLKAQGFHFENSWPGVSEYTIVNDLGFKEGVITSGEQGKGAMLEAFLNYLSSLDTPIKFNKVIFIDDFYPNIENVRVVKSLGLCNKFLGVHYTEKERMLTNLNKAFLGQEQQEEANWDFDLLSVLPE